MSSPIPCVCPEFSSEYMFVCTKCIIVTGGMEQVYYFYIVFSVTIPHVIIVRKMGNDTPVVIHIIITHKNIYILCAAQANYKTASVRSTPGWTMMIKDAKSVFQPEMMMMIMEIKWIFSANVFIETICAVFLLNSAFCQRKSHRYESCQKKIEQNDTQTPRWYFHFQYISCSLSGDDSNIKKRLDAIQSNTCSHFEN